MNVIVGLGNPGKQYQNTRHNTGFVFLDHLSHVWSNTASWNLEQKLKAEISKTTNQKGNEVLLVKPQTFMNASGEAVKKIVDYYRLLPKTSLVLVYDDLDIEFGSWKIQMGKSPRIHNGVNSVINHLGTGEFWNIRIGIAGSLLGTIKEHEGSVAQNYVLKPFSLEEKQQLPGLFEKILVAARATCPVF
ncbi:MAG: aminoacyl-tRNA hydrolase [Patescibacteria group bacterium]|jgi:PTH1 family peptidyl-tRNA hydrolase